MTVPDFQSLMLPVLTATTDGEISASDLRDRVARKLELSEDDLREMLPSGRQTTFANRIAWANVFLQRAGLVDKIGRGIYRATEAGLKVIKERPSRIGMTDLERFPNYVEWRQRSKSALSTKVALPESYEGSATPEGANRKKLSNVGQHAGDRPP